MKRLLIAALVMICGVAQADTIVIDPDLFSVGTDLSHLFPAVTLIDGFGEHVIAATSPAPALDPNVFGVGTETAFGFFVGPPGPNSPPLTPSPQFSFVALFNEPIESVTFRLFELAGGFGTQYSTYDSTGHVMSGGVFGPVARVPYDAVIDLHGATALAIGGVDSSAITSIDRITLQVLPTPLPSGGVLFGSGLIVAFLLVRRRGEIASSAPG